jgi:hypothetical protein
MSIDYSSLDKYLWIDNGFSVVERSNKYSSRPIWKGIINNSSQGHYWHLREVAVLAQTPLVCLRWLMPRLILIG